MFNSKDLPVLKAGGNEKCMLSEEIYWNSNGEYKFKFNVDIIKNIQSAELDELFLHYKKLCEDIMWIQKYVYGLGDSKTFVDYIFDYDEKKDINKEIHDCNKEIQDCSEKIKRNEKNSFKHIYCKDPKNIDLHRSLDVLNMKLRELTNLKIILAKLDKPREYYYANYNEFLDFFGKKNQHGIRDFFAGNRIVRGQIDLDSLCGKSLNVYGNEYYYHIYHQFDREKKEKLHYLKNICMSIGIIKIIGTSQPLSCGKPLDNHDELEKKKFHRYVGNGDLILDHVEYILTKKIFPSEKSRRLIKSDDFDELLKIGEVIVELIEYLRPDIILKCDM